MADLWNGRLFRFILFYAAIYAITALLTDAPLLILIENGVAMSVAAAVCVTYAPVLPGSLRSNTPSKGDYLGTGIFFVSLSIFGMRALSFVARDVGYPWVYNSDWTTGVIAYGILGGLLHLQALGAQEGGAKRLRLSPTGIVVGVSIFVCFVAWNVHGASGPHPAIELR